MRRWLANMDGRSTTLDNLPALDRTAYGAACRLVAQTLAAISARYSHEDPSPQDVNSPPPGLTCRIFTCTLYKEELVLWLVRLDALQRIVPVVPAALRARKFWPLLPNC